jgi:uncharacterized protein
MGYRVAVRRPPRYLPDRPLPLRPYSPGRGPRPPVDAATRADGDEVAFLWGVDLYNAGCYWEAHEVWEDLWRAAAAGSIAAHFYQGLIQRAAAALQATQGKRAGADRLLARARGHLARVVAAAGPVYRELDVAAFANADDDAPPIILSGAAPAP